MLEILVNVLFVEGKKCLLTIASTGLAGQARSPVKRMLVISLPWVVQAMHLLKVSDLNSQIPLRCFQ